MVTTRSRSGGSTRQPGGRIRGGGTNGGRILTPTAALVLVAALAFKVLLYPAYRSTDFEVHRNWLAITHSLPLSEWYVDETSEWTLDYPPLFAWFECLLSQVARYVDPEMLVVSNLNYASEATVAFQRTTVVVTEGVLLLAAYLFSKRVRPGAFALLGFLVALNPGLLVVDHIHFQYNGLLLGVLMLSLEALQRDRVLLSALLFSVLVNMKHLFAVAGPFYFVYMLRRYCVGKFAMLRFLLLGGVVAIVCCVSFGPFAHTKTIGNLLGRLFPFGRGLCHAYWAPNFWAIYSFADKVLVRAGQRFGMGVDVGKGHLSGGVVGVSKFGLLPQVAPGATLGLVLVAMLPCLIRTWRRPVPGEILRGVAYANLCGFVFGYHVHEKAVLHFMIPMAFGALQSEDRARAHAHASWPAYVALLPLLHRPQERLLKHLIILGYCLAIGAAHGGEGGRRGVYPGLLALVAAYCAFQETAAEAGYESRYAFLPLLLLSVCAGFGLLRLFVGEFLYYCKLMRL